MTGPYQGKSTECSVEVVGFWDPVVYVRGRGCIFFEVITLLLRKVKEGQVFGPVLLNDLIREWTYVIYLYDPTLDLGLPN